MYAKDIHLLSPDDFAICIPSMKRLMLIEFAFYCRVPYIKICLLSTSPRVKLLNSMHSESSK